MIKRDIPNEIVIELTNKCNLDCDFCFNKQENSEKELSKEEIFEILEDISDSGIEAVRFTGGEPFLRKDLIEILKKAKSLNLYVILNTNASLINEGNIDCFNHIDLALFSLHSPDRFGAIKKKITLLKNYKLEIMLATIAILSNIKNLEPFYKFVSSIKQSNFVEWFLLRQIPNKINEKPLSTENIQELYEKIIKYNKRYNLNIKVANALPFCTIKNNLATVCNGGSFDSGYTRLVINCEGDYKSDYFSDVLGNIKDKKIIDIWNSEKLRDVGDYEKVKNECKKCYYLSKCKGGLLNKEYLYNFENIRCLASIIIPTFNDSKRLALLIKSLENQTCNNFEIIVVDDGSTDNTKEIVEDLKNKSEINIRYFYLNNTDIFGAAIARNFGAKKAKSNILIFLDQDNVAHPKLIENYLKEHENKDTILGYYAGYGNEKYYYDFEKLKTHVEKNKVIKTIIPEFRENIFRNPRNYKNQEWKYFASGNFSIKRDLFLKFKFDENIIKWGGGDIELGYRLVEKGYFPIFCKNCLTYNSSDKKMLDKDKFISSMSILIYIFNKYKTKELKDYCFERFYHTPINLRGNSKLINLGDALEFKPPINYAFIRIDDVYKKDENLLNILEFTIKNSIPVNLQIIPDLLEEDLINFLKDLKQKYPNLISFNQHGFSHANNNPKKTPEYEFGSFRSYKQQKEDILKGKEILKQTFENDFNKIFTPPFHRYDKNTLKILDELNFKMISARDNIGLDNKELIFLNSNFGLIKQYNPYIFFSREELLEQINYVHNNKKHFGIVLHPQNIDSKELNKFKEIIKFAKTKGYIFNLMEKYLEDLDN